MVTWAAVVPGGRVKVFAAARSCAWAGFSSVVSAIPGLWPPSSFRVTSTVDGGFVDVKPGDGWR